MRLLIPSILAFLGFLTALNLTACGPGNHSGSLSGKHSELSQIITANTPKEAKDIVEHAYVKCGEPSGCPLSVGLVVTREKDSNQIGICTGSLIQDNLVLTNSHCIPKTIKDGASCVGVISFQIPASGNETAEILHCSKIRDYSEEDVVEQDYSIIEVSETAKHKPLKVSREGLKDKTPYTMWKMMNTSNTINASIEKDTCTVYHHNFDLIHNNSDLSTAHVHGGCQSIPGNSGSPLVNENSEIAGINQSHFDPTATIEAMKRNNIPLDAPVIELNEATNTACIDFKDSRIEEAKKCIVTKRAQRTDSPDDQNEAVTKNIFLNDLSLKINSWMKDGNVDLGLRWKATQYWLGSIKNYSIADDSEYPNYTYDIVATPTCIEDALKFDNMLRQNKGAIKFQSPLWRYYAKYSNALVPYYTSEKSEGLRTFTLTSADYKTRETIFSPYAQNSLHESTMSVNLKVPSLSPCEK